MLVSRGAASTSDSGDAPMFRACAVLLGVFLAHKTFRPSGRALGEGLGKELSQEELVTCREPWNQAGSTGVGVVGSASRRFTLKESVAHCVLTNTFPTVKTFLSSLPILYLVPLYNFSFSDGTAG